MLNPPDAEIVNVGEPFNFTLSANSIFNDSDADPLNYYAQLNDGTALPSWLYFDSQANTLSFNGTAPNQGRMQINLTAKDPLNASISTQLDIIAVPTNTTHFASGTTVLQIAGGVIGGLVGLAALAGSIFGLFSHARNKISRETEQFADLIRAALNLKDVDNFDSEAGQKFVTTIHNLQNSLQQAGIDPTTMRSLELQQLANDVAEAARNKFSSATDWLGRSAIKVTDLNDNLQSLINEVQVLRAGSQKYR